MSVTARSGWPTSTVAGVALSDVTEVISMPSEHMPAGGGDRQRFPHLKDDIGEDPARFLDRPIFDGGSGTSSPGLFIRARIRGIDRIAVVRAWLAVERRLDRGPRDRIIELLEEREQRLEEIGERPDRLQERDGRELPDTQWYLVDEDGERTPWAEVDRRAAGESLAATDRAVATDGGESA